MKIYIKIALLVLLVAPIFVSATTVHAQTMPLDRLKSVNKTAGFTNESDDAAIGLASTLVKSFLGLLGIIFMILSLYAGYQWMTAQGETAKVDSAQKILTSAVIGLIIVISSYAIWGFVNANIITQTLKDKI